MSISVLGIDPASIRNLGFAIVNVDNDRIPKIITHNTIIFPDFDSDGERLTEIYRKIEEIIVSNKPNIVAIELSQGFGMSFVRSKLQESVGVIKMCCFNNGVRVVEKAPKHIKLIVAGTGKAKKKDIKNWVKKFIKMENPKTEHEADAIACILTYLIDEKYIDTIHNIREKHKHKQKRK